jgi:hypothetical protein
MKASRVRERCNDRTYETSKSGFAKFKIEAFDELGIATHPKAQKAFDIAWEERHAHGYHEVFDLLEDLAQLLK